MAVGGWVGGSPGGWGGGSSGQWEEAVGECSFTERQGSVIAWTGSKGRQCPWWLRWKNGTLARTPALFLPGGRHKLWDVQPISRRDGQPTCLLKGSFPQVFIRTRTRWRLTLRYRCLSLPSPLSLPPSPNSPHGHRPHTPNTAFRHTDTHLVWSLHRPLRFRPVCCHRLSLHCLASGSESL